MPSSATVHVIDGKNIDVSLTTELTLATILIDDETLHTGVTQPRNLRLPADQ